MHTNGNYNFTDQINIDGGTLQRGILSPPVDSNPAWDIMDIMNNVKVSQTPQNTFDHLAVNYNL